MDKTRIRKSRRDFVNFLMKKTACKWIFALLMLSQISGCGTIASLIENDYAVYAGVMKDFSMIQNGGVFGVLSVIDLPLSFIMDTLLLPVTLSQ